MNKPLTPDQWALFCQTIVSMPSPVPWLRARNEALNWFFYSFGTRTQETSKYRRSDVFEGPGVLRWDIPLGSLQSGDSRRLAWIWRVTPPECGAALLRWDAVYPARRHPDMPLWLSWKHHTVIDCRCRESLFRPLKAAGLACGLDWVNPECVRMTKICHGIAQQLARDQPTTMQDWLRIVEAAQVDMRHKTMQHTLDMLKRANWL
jgi:hypothetical protein